MNWRRGLFRLWIVGSALFVIAVAFVSYGEIKKQFDGPFKNVFVPVLCGEARGEAGTDYAIKDKGRPGPSDQYTKPNFFETCWYAISKFRTFYPEYNATADGELIRKLNAALNILTFDDIAPDPEPNPWATLGIWAVIAFGIPLVVLVLGSSLVWAFSGFAAKRTGRYSRPFQDNEVLAQRGDKGKLKFNEHQSNRMPRFMQQELFDVAAITHAIMLRLVATATPERAAALKKDFSEVMEHYIHDYPNENFQVLLTDLRAASHEVERITNSVYDALFQVSRPDKETVHLALLNELSQTVEQQSRKKQPLFKRIFGGTYFNYEKSPLHDRVEKCKKNVSLASMMILAKRLGR